MLAGTEHDGEAGQRARHAKAALWPADDLALVVIVLVPPQSVIKP